MGVHMMRLNASLLALILAVSGYALLAQAPPQSAPRDDSYASPHRPARLTGENVPVKDDALGRIDWMREVMGGDLTPEFMEAVMVAADAQRAQYGPDGRGAIQVPAGGKWTNIGPQRSNWIQNGLQVAESDTGRVRTFLVHPTNSDVLYVLTSSGGLWKTTNFSDPRPAWRATTDFILSHVWRCRRVRKKSRNNLSRNRRPVRSRRGWIRAPVHRRRADVVEWDQARPVDSHP
jgi:hypothetical protein